MSEVRTGNDAAFIEALQNTDALNAIITTGAEFHCASSSRIGHADLEISFEVLPSKEQAAKMNVVLSKLSVALDVGNIQEVNGKYYFDTQISESMRRSVDKTKIAVDNVKQRVNQETPSTETTDVGLQDLVAQPSQSVGL